MKCKICGSTNIKTIYQGKIRYGKFGHLTDEDVPMLQCEQCKMVWHEKMDEVCYDDSSYRNMMGEEDNIKCFNYYHDADVLEKLKYMGTDIFRDKVVMDIGCGGGAILDYLQGVAKKVIGVEPTEGYRKLMKEKGYTTFAYTSELGEEYEHAIDIIFSFDVIEHVDDPIQFIKDAKRVLADDGILIIGTPTLQPVMREAVGSSYDSFLFSVQHPWVFDKLSFEECIKQAGFEKFEISYKQRYGLNNLIGWIKEKRPVGNIKCDWVSDTIDELWKREVERLEKADYMIAYIRK